MRIRLLLFIIINGLICCREKNNEKPVDTEMAIKDLKFNGVVHDSLTTKQIKEIERIQSVFSEVNSSSLDETINNFKRDKNPDSEIAIWLKMADAYERFTLNKHVEEHDKKEEAYQIVLLRSAMTEKDVMDKVDITYLTKDEVKEILSYYLDPPQPLKVQKK